MQLHELPTRTRKTKQRVGRGGKRGTTSGRGTKGQKSRSGHVIRPAERDLILRIPKHRGFRNKPTSGKFRAIILKDLEKAVLALGKKGLIVDHSLLQAMGLIFSSREPVKILDGGDISGAITLRGIPVSKTAREKIEKAGGKVE